MGVGAIASAMPESVGPVLGVLGGLGPAATADFLSKFTEATDASVDQEHIASITYQNPSTPDRSTAILQGGESPLPALLHGIRFLNGVGVDLIAIPCNSSHHWFDDLVAASEAPIANIVDAVAEQIACDRGAPMALGLLSTDGTAKSGVYSLLGERGHTVLDLTDLGELNPVPQGIHAVKAGDLEEGRRLFLEAIDLFRQRGAEGIIFGCTEVSAALGGTNLEGDLPMWDSSEALARACAKRLSAKRDSRNARPEEQ